MEDKAGAVRDVMAMKLSGIEKFKKWLFKVSDYFDESLAFTAVRQGMIMLIPLLVLGAMALMLSSLPIPLYQEMLSKIFNGKLVELLQFVRSASLDLFAVALAMTTSVSYASLKRKEKGVGIGDAVMVMLIALVSLAGYLGIQEEGFSVSALGTINIFTALLVTLLSGFLFFQIKEKGLFRIRHRGMEADGLYVDAVSGIVPALLIVVFLAFCGKCL